MRKSRVISKQILLPVRLPVKRQITRDKIPKMDNQPDASLIEQELDRAESARKSGNEGMARVCARRAAGIAIGNYLKRKGYPDPGKSAYDRLRILCDLPDTPEDLRQVALHFLIKVTPDYKLPLDVDLISEARWLINRLGQDTDIQR